MIDVGNDAGFTREFSGPGAFASGRPSRGDAGSRSALPGPDPNPDPDDSSAPPAGSAPEAEQSLSGRSALPRTGGPEQGSVQGGVQGGVPGSAQGGVQGNGQHALDLVALQALAGTGEPAAMIARQVADMAQGLAALADKLVGQPAATSQDVLEADCIAFLEGQFRIRRLRSRHLPGLSLGEPAWDILLDLAIAHFWRRETSVTSLCIAADVPSTTALRWINSMTKAGLIVRRPCQRDGRRSFLAISTASYQAMLALAADALRTVDRVRSRYQRGPAA